MVANAKAAQRWKKKKLWKVGALLFLEILSYLTEQQHKYLVGQIFFFFLFTVQPWHTQTGYYSIFTVWLQCPLLPLRRYCRLESFASSFFNQYPLKYNFSFCPLCGTLVWVLAHSPNCAPMIFETCCSCQVGYPHDVRSTLAFSALFLLFFFPLGLM